MKKKPFNSLVKECCDLLDKRIDVCEKKAKACADTRNLIVEGRDYWLKQAEQTELAKKVMLL